MGLKNFLNHNPMELLEMLNDRLADLASRMGINSIVLYIAAGVIAALVGLAGMHLAKVFCMFGLGGIGYLVGVELFDFLVAEVSGLSKMPDFLSYVFGAVIAIVFFAFGWKRCLHVMFAVFAFVGYALVIHYVDDNYLLALGGAILLAMLATLCVKVAFIALTSAVGGFTLISLLGAMIPKASLLQLGDNKNAIWIALAAAVVMMLFQLLTTRRYSVTER